MTRAFLPPADGPAVRGTVVLLPGRGEHPGVYERFGRRLAVDAYAVYALDVSLPDPPELVRAKVDEIAATAIGPVVLAGSDTGALRALELIHGGVQAAGLVLVGLPDPSEAVDAAEDGDWDWELAARTTCPTHRARLDRDESFVRGSLAQPIPPALASVLDEPAVKGIGVPALVLHGGSDPIASVDHAARVAELMPRAELAVVGTAPHDVLNDATHRTVAAHIVQWLERLRGGPDLTSIINVLTREPPPGTTVPAAAVLTVPAAAGAAGR